MSLSPDLRRAGKEKTIPERIPKLFLNLEDVEEFRERYPSIPVRNYKGGCYVDIRDFPSCSFIKFEPERSTRQVFSFAILKFCRFKKAFPDDLVALYREDSEKAALDLRSFLMHELSQGLSSNYVRSELTSLFT